MALRLAWSTCRSARFRPMGSRRSIHAPVGHVCRPWGNNAPRGRTGLRARRAGAARRRLRRRGARQRPAPAAADPGQRRDQRRRDQRAAAADRDRPRTDPADPAEPARRAAAGPLRRAAQRRLRRRQPDRRRLPSRGARRRQGPQLGAALRQRQRHPAGDPPHRRLPISAADIPGAKPAKLVVGPYRTSSENDVLLP